MNFKFFVVLTYDHIDSNKRKTAILITVFLLLIIALGWTFSYAYHSPSILFFAVGFSVIMSLISYFYSDSITLALSRARPVDRSVNEELYRVVENLSITAGLPTPRIYVIDDTALNAFATGRDPKHAVMVFTTGILAKLDRQELEGVASHELSHIGNYDIRLSTIVVILVGIITLLADWFLRMSFWGRRKSSNSESGQLQMIVGIIGIVLAILSPIFATLLQLAISRKREFLADASGALLTRYPEGLASALQKISMDREPLEAANKATAHLYIANPLKNNTGGVGLFASLFNTHPPIEERIKRLKEMNLG